MPVCALCSFECKTNNVDSQVLRMYPSRGMLKGGEQMAIKCVFAPRRAEKHLLKCVIVTRSAPNVPTCASASGDDELDLFDGSGNDGQDTGRHKTYKQLFPLRFIAEAVVGRLSVSDAITLHFT